MPQAGSRREPREAARRTPPARRPGRTRRRGSRRGRPGGSAGSLPSRSAIATAPRWASFALGKRRRRPSRSGWAPARSASKSCSWVVQLIRFWPSSGSSRRAVVLRRLPKPPGIDAGARSSEAGRHRALVAHERHELRPCPGPGAAVPGRSRAGRGDGGERLLAVGQRPAAAGGSWATSVRTCSGCWVTSTSAFTAPPLLAKISTGPAPRSAITRCRSSACSSGVDVARAVGPARCARRRAGRRPSRRPWSAKYPDSVVEAARVHRRGDQQQRRGAVRRRPARGRRSAASPRGRRGCGSGSRASGLLLAGCRSG